MCIKRIKKYFDDLGKREKIQTKEMERSIEHSKDIAEAYLQGGKAYGEIMNKRLNKEKKQKTKQE